MKATQETIREIERLYGEYKKEIRVAEGKGYLVGNTAKTYLLHSGNFVKWCKDHFIPGEKNTTRKTS